MNIEKILKSYKVIAVVGFSDNHARPSYRIARYMAENGFVVYGVNPRLGGKEIDGIKCFAELKDLPEGAEIINVFRRSEFVPDLMKEIMKLKYKPEVIWTQIGVISKEAKELSESSGINFVQNKCIMVEHSNL